MSGKEGRSGMAIEMLMNGAPVRLDVDDDTPLLEALRGPLGLTGSKYGCGEGECGACTVLVGGRAARSCVTPIAEVRGKDVLTIEGVERDGQLHPLQQAFLDVGAFQCGYCTPGMIMSGITLLNSCPDPSKEEIVEALEGNICRCGGYLRIIRAVRQAAAALQMEQREKSEEAPV
jgi:aerobic-type carbon monoxide dehydrogenase small subunit (CoxS/CutS family)